jgi:hypothetical protein
VQRLRDRGEPITLKEAARLVRCITDDVRALIADGNAQPSTVYASPSTCLRSKHLLQGSILGFAVITLVFLDLSENSVRRITR